MIIQLWFWYQQSEKKIFELKDYHIAVVLLSGNVKNTFEFNDYHIAVVHTFTLDLKPFDRSSIRVPCINEAKYLPNCVYKWELKFQN